MGSTDVTCAVSGLPIQYKEPCRFIFLRQVIAWDDDLNPGSWEHVWTQWLPLSLPVKGLYDGYGRVMAGYREERGDYDSHHVDYEPDPLLKFQVEAIARVAEPFPESERLGDRDYESFPNTIESLMAACERGWLKVKLPRGRLKDDEEQQFQTLRVSPYYVSERAWQAVIAPGEEGIGLWRGKLKKHHAEDDKGLLLTKGLKATIDHYRDWPERRGHIKKTLESTKETPQEVEATLELLERCFPMTMDDLGPHHEQMPDVLGIGGDWEAAVSDRKSLYEFGDEDWRKMDDLVLDLRAFFMTMRHELRRPMYPSTYRDQFHLPDMGLDAHRMLTVYVQQWCNDMEEAYEREQREWDEKQAAKERGET